MSAVPTKKAYERLSDDFIEMHLMDYYEESTDVSFRKFCTEQHILTKRMSLKRVGDKLGLEELKKDGASGLVFCKKLLAYLQSRKVGASEHLKKLACENTVLTDDEIKLVAETCAMLSNMGLGIDEDTCLQVCNEILAQRIEVKDFVPITKGVVTRIIKKKTYSDQFKVIPSIQREYDRHRLM